MFRVLKRDKNKTESTTPNSSNSIYFKVSNLCMVRMREDYTFMHGPPNVDLVIEVMEVRESNVGALTSGLLLTCSSQCRVRCRGFLCSACLWRAMFPARRAYLHNTTAVWRVIFPANPDSPPTRFVTTVFKPSARSSRIKIPAARQFLPSYVRFIHTLLASSLFIHI